MFLYVFCRLWDVLFVLVGAWLVMWGRKELAKRLDSIARRLHGSRCRCNIAGSRESAIVPLPTATERYG